ncbi:MAG: hypothetical protein ACSLEM_05985 [Candidatus Malihini olakiniferum]
MAILPSLMQTDVGEQFFTVRGYSLAQGIIFLRTSAGGGWGGTLAQEAVINQKTLKTCFLMGRILSVK